MKKTLGILSLLVILVCGIYSVRAAFDAGSGRRISTVNIADLYANPDAYEGSELGSGADMTTVIVEENLDKTMAANNVSAVVYDFRGFDTIGESFILLTAIAGSYVILNGMKKPKEDGGETDEA